MGLCKVSPCPCLFWDFLSPMIAIEWSTVWNFISRTIRISESSKISFLKKWGLKSKTGNSNALWDKASDRSSFENNYSSKEWGVESAHRTLWGLTWPFFAQSCSNLMSNKTLGHYQLIQTLKNIILTVVVP